MVPRQFVQAQSGQIIAAVDRDFELLLWEQGPAWDGLVTNFIKDTDINLVI